MRPFRLSDIVPNPRRDVSEELRFHLDMRVEELMATGMSREEARRKAAESFGDVAAVEAECRTVREERSRSYRRREWWSEIRGDTLYAVRTLRRSPLFALTAGVTLALGIGAAVSGFTLVNGVLLRPLPYHEPARLAMVWMTGQSNGTLETQWPLSIPNFVDLQARMRTTRGMAAFRAWPYALRSGDGAQSEIVPSARVSAELFSVLGTPPLLGRGFAREDASSGSARVAVIGNDLWRRRFNASRDVIGRRVTLSGEDFTIVGVMPSGFAFPRGAELPGGFQFAPRTELWTPLVFSERELTQRGTGNLAVVARLAPGSTLDAARADLSRIMRGLITDHPRYFNPGTGITAATLAEQAAAPVRRPLWLLMGAVTVVLLIALLNTANLLAARVSGREHELAVRRALGASRFRVLRQLVTENVLLATLGAAVGFAVAAAATRALVARIPAGLPRADDVVVDWRVLVATLVVAIGAGITFGMVSAWHGSGDAADVVHGNTRATGGRARRTGRRVLVTLEVALSLVLLVGAGLLVRSYARLASVSPGFEPRGAMTASVLMPISGSFDQARDGASWAAFFDNYERRLNSAAGVEAAGGISSLPLSGAVESTNFTVEGAPPLAAGATSPHADYQVVTPNWFRAARVSMLAGRTFDSRDRRETAPAIIVSAALARANFPGESLSAIIGRRITGGLSRVPQAIVGIAGDIHQTALDAPPKPVMYLPESQFPYPFLSFVVRGKDATADPATLLPVMRTELAAIDPSLALDATRTLQDVLDASLARQRFGMLLAGVFAVAALLLATVGLYGVIATGVAQRTREIGIRMALGATRHDVLSAVMKEGVAVTVVGVLLGTAGALAAGRLLREQLYDVSARDPSIYATVAIVTAAVALGATLVPAWRATRLDPVSALRGE